MEDQQSIAPNAQSPAENQYASALPPKRFFKKFLLFAWEFVKVAVIALVIVLPVRYFLFQPFIVKGESMVPNFQSGDYLIVDEISYRFSSPHRGDVVVLKYPLDTTQRFIKRIIGLPGETVEVRNGKIKITLVNGSSLVLDEKNYLPNVKNTEGNITVSLAGDEYFVLGDNRSFSYDSRRWTNAQGQLEPALPKDDIIGRVVFRIFPLDHMVHLSSPTY